jgi:hypothetical protein
VSFCDLRGYVEAQAKPLPAGTNLPSEKGLEQLCHRLVGYRLTTVTNAEFEQAVFR